MIFCFHNPYDHELCNGIIIGPNHILTSDWCVTGRRNYELKVGVGSDRVTELEKFDVEQIHFYPSEEYYENNIAILVLKKSLIFSETIKPIKLIQNDEVIPDSVTMTVTSWEQTIVASEENLQTLDVQYISRSNCTNMYGIYLYNSEFCSIHVDSKKSLCYADMGGPVVFNDTLYGVVSFGMTCSNYFSFDIITNILYSRDWIRKITGI